MTTYALPSGDCSPRFRFQVSTSKWAPDYHRTQSMAVSIIRHATVQTDGSTFPNGLAILCKRMVILRAAFQEQVQADGGESSTHAAVEWREVGLSAERRTARRGRQR